MRAVIIYWSKGGNTEKVELAIEKGLKEAAEARSLSFGGLAAITRARFKNKI